ncbi:MAG: YlxR family protein [Pseudomonadota bacterium]
MTGPVRTCVGCKKRRKKSELLRLIADSRGHLQVSQGAPGRGMYVCPNEDCISEALRGSNVKHALRRGVATIAADRFLEAAKLAVSQEITVMLDAAVEDGRARWEEAADLALEAGLFSLEWKGKLAVISDVACKDRFLALAAKLSCLELYEKKRR